MTLGEMFWKLDGWITASWVALWLSGVELLPYSKKVQGLSTKRDYRLYGMLVEAITSLENQKSISSCPNCRVHIFVTHKVVCASST